MAPKSKAVTPAAKSTPATTKPVEKTVNAPPQQAPTPVTETTALAQNVAQSPAPTGSMPAWLVKVTNEQAPRGYDKMDAADFILPRLVLAQSQTPEVLQKATNGYGIDVGDIFDNLSKTILCKAGESLLIIPVVLGKSRMYFGDYDKDEGVLCRSDDALTARKGGIGKDEGDQPTNDCAKCVFKEFDEEEGKPGCSIFYNIIVLLPAFEMGAYVWSNKHVNVKVAKRFLSTSRQLKTDMFAQKFELKSTQESNGKYTYQNYDFKGIGWVDRDQYITAEGFFKSLEGKTWTPNTDDIDEEVATPASTDGETVDGEVTNREPGSDDAPVNAKPAAPAAGAEEDAF